MPEDNRRLKLYAECNHVGGDYTDFIKLPKRWDSWTEEKRDKWAEEQAEQHFWNQGFGWSHELTSTSDEEYEANYYSDANE